MKNAQIQIETLERNIETQEKELAQARTSLTECKQKLVQLTTLLERRLATYRTYLEKFPHVSDMASSSNAGTSGSGSGSLPVSEEFDLDLGAITAGCNQHREEVGALATTYYSFISQSVYQQSVAQIFEDILALENEQPESELLAEWSLLPELKFRIGMIKEELKSNEVTIAAFNHIKILLVQYSAKISPSLSTLQDRLIVKKWMNSLFEIFIKSGHLMIVTDIGKITTLVQNYQNTQEKIVNLLSEIEKMRNDKDALVTVTMNVGSTGTPLSQLTGPSTSGPAAAAALRTCGGIVVTREPAAPESSQPAKKPSGP